MRGAAHGFAEAKHGPAKATGPPHHFPMTCGTSVPGRWPPAAEAMPTIMTSALRRPVFRNVPACSCCARAEQTRHTGRMGSLLVHILPIALAIALEPICIIAALVMPATERPLANSLAYQESTQASCSTRAVCSSHTRAWARSCSAPMASKAACALSSASRSPSRRPICSSVSAPS